MMMSLHKKLILFVIIVIVISRAWSGSINCLQRLSADDTSRHCHFILSAVCRVKCYIYGYSVWQGHFPNAS